MRTEIIEILQKKYPEYCMQHIDTADEILRLFNVVGQSEQYHCELYDFGRQKKRCEKQCDNCKWMEEKQ